MVVGTVVVGFAVVVWGCLVVGASVALTSSTSLTSESAMPALTSSVSTDTDAEVVVAFTVVVFSVVTGSAVTFCVVLCLSASWLSDVGGFLNSTSSTLVCVTMVCGLTEDAGTVGLTLGSFTGLCLSGSGTDGPPTSTSLGCWARKAQQLPK